jgi:hypothetical protein
MRKQPTPEQKAAAAEKRARLQELSAAIAAMSDEQRAAILDKFGAVPVCTGNLLSVHNSCLLLAQRDDVSLVGGFNQWREVGRQVAKGSRALYIIVPSKTNDDDPQAKPRFVTGCVFDVTQTEPITAEVTV